MGSERIDLSSLVVEGAVFPERRVGPTVPTRVEGLCANCDQTFVAASGHLTPYCSPRCKAIPKVVRYVRRKRYAARLSDDVQYAIRIKVALALSGGYGDTARRLPQAIRRAVRERDQDRCVLCGAPGEEIDHINGDGADSVNLRLLCPACHHEVTEAHLRPIDDPEVVALHAEIGLRSLAPRPLRECDDEETWSYAWRAWVLEHPTPDRGADRQAAQQRSGGDGDAA